VELFLGFLQRLADGLDQRFDRLLALFQFVAGDALMFAQVLFGQLEKGLVVPL
jgi:hypothetical protein